jgi:hypothetical protein
MIVRHWAACAALALVFVSSNSFADDWEWSVAPYVWLADTTLDSSVESSSGPSIHFKGLLETFDFGAQARFEGQRDRFGFILDASNLQLSDRRRQGPIEVDTDFAVSLIEGLATVGFGEKSETSGWDLLLGARVVLLDLEIELETGGIAGIERRTRGKGTLTDAMVGVRYRQALGDKWSLGARVDLASGDTDRTANAMVSFTYKTTSRGNLVLGYRHLDANFGDVDGTGPELTLSGPIVGYAFSF